MELRVNYNIFVNNYLDVVVYNTRPRYYRASCTCCNTGMYVFNAQRKGGVCPYCEMHIQKVRAAITIKNFLKKVLEKKRKKHVKMAAFVVCRELNVNSGTVASLVFEMFKKTNVRDAIRDRAKRNYKKCIHEIEILELLFPHSDIVF